MELLQNETQITAMYKDLFCHFSCTYHFNTCVSAIYRTQPNFSGHISFVGLQWVKVLLNVILYKVTVTVNMIENSGITQRQQGKWKCPQLANGTVYSTYQSVLCYEALHI